MGDQRATTTTASFCGVETDECTDTTSNPCCDDYECTGYSPFYKSCKLKQDATCLGRWADCTNGIGGCCGGLDCVGNQFYRQCQKQTCGVDTDRCATTVVPLSIPFRTTTTNRRRRVAAITNASGTNITRVAN